MRKQQIFSIMEALEQRFENLTEDEFINLSTGSGLLTILENEIDNALGDAESIDNFWKNYQTHYYSTDNPYPECLTYMILEKFFNRLAADAYRKFTQIPMHEIRVNMGNIIVYFENVALCGRSFKKVDHIKYMSNGMVEIKYDYECPDAFGGASYTTTIIPNSDIDYILIER